MKKKQLPILLTAALLGISVSACGVNDNGSAGQSSSEITADQDGGSDTEDSGQSIEDTEPAQAQTSAASDDSAKNDMSVANKDAAETENGAEAASCPVSVTLQETHDEIKAEDGTVLLENTMSMPVVSIEGAEDAAAKINADIETYFNLSADTETLEMAKSDYEASQADKDGGWFHGYAQSVTAEVIRMDDKVLSLEITSYSDTGGAHGNYGITGLNYNVKTGEAIDLYGLTDDYEAFHAAALDYIVNLADTPTYREKLFDPSKNDIDSALFEGANWSFSQSGIRFFSDPYVLGPYASGEIYFTLPYQKAYDLRLKEDYRYHGNFMEERYYTSQYDSDTMETLIDGTPEYYFDLNGDGAEEGIAFYGQTYASGNESAQDALYIDGKDWGSVVAEALGDAPSRGFQENYYALYDRNPADGLTEIAVLFTEFRDENGNDYDAHRPYTYLFQYTADQELVFTERLDGYITNPLSTGT